VLLALTIVLTAFALRDAGAWVRQGHAIAPAVEDPIVALDRDLGAVSGLPAAAGLRDPFGLAVPVTPERRHTVAVRHAPPPPPSPVLTAIVWDADPRALIRWSGREWTVRAGMQFDVFQVTSITRTQVVLKRGDESVVLTRQPQGE